MTTRTLEQFGYRIDSAVGLEENIGVDAVRVLIEDDAEHSLWLAGAVRHGDWTVTREDAWLIRWTDADGTELASWTTLPQGQRDRDGSAWRLSCTAYRKATP